jgi:hypothetical protein
MPPLEEEQDNSVDGFTFDMGPLVIDARCFRSFLADFGKTTDYYEPKVILFIVYFGVDEFIAIRR